MQPRVAEAETSSPDMTGSPEQTSPPPPHYEREGTRTCLVCDTFLPGARLLWGDCVSHSCGHSVFRSCRHFQAAILHNKSALILRQTCCSGTFHV